MRQRPGAATALWWIRLDRARHRSHPKCSLKAECENDAIQSLASCSPGHPGPGTAQAMQGFAKCLAYVGDSVQECSGTVVPVDCRAAAISCGRRVTSSSQLARVRRAAVLSSVSVTKGIPILLAPDFGATMSTEQSDQGERLQAPIRAGSDQAGAEMYTYAWPAAPGQREHSAKATRHRAEC